MARRTAPTAGSVARVWTSVSGSRSAPRSPDATGAVAAYARAGVDELILDATVSDPTQVDLLAEVVF